MAVLRITEYLDLDLDSEQWRCHSCGGPLGSARDMYKKGCLVYERNPREIYQAVVEGDLTYSPDPEWCRIVEFYCPKCGTMIECEALPPGYPLTNDIELNIDDLKRQHAEPR